MKFILVLISLFSFSLRAEGPDKPLFELGAGGLIGHSADYPAAEQGRMHYVAIPYFIYRGSYFRVDDQDGASARLLRNDWFRLDLSASASFPADSENNRAREGMPDLDWMGEFGPKLNIFLHKDPDKFNLKFGLPLRAALSTNFHNLHHRGWVLAPKLSLAVFNLWRRDSSGYMSLAAYIGDRQMNNYFYSVDTAYVKPGRAYYSAHPGLISYDYLAAYSIKSRSKKIEMIFGTDLSFHHEAANQYSPLFKNKFNVSAFVAVVYLFFESSARAKVP